MWTIAAQKMVPVPWLSYELGPEVTWNDSIEKYRHIDSHSFLFMFHESPQRTEELIFVYGYIILEYVTYIYIYLFIIHVYIIYKPWYICKFWEDVRATFCVNLNAPDVQWWSGGVGSGDCGVTEDKAAHGKMIRCLYHLPLKSPIASKISYMAGIGTCLRDVWVWSLLRSYCRRWTSPIVDGLKSCTTGMYSDIKHSTYWIYYIYIYYIIMIVMTTIVMTMIIITIYSTCNVPIISIPNQWSIPQVSRNPNMKGFPS